METDFTKEQEQALLRYEELKIQIKAIEKEIEPLKPIVKELVVDGEKLHTPTGLGAFELKKRDNWTFSQEIQDQEQDLKDVKKEAIAKGEATSDPTVYVEYKANKKKKEIEE